MIVLMKTKRKPKQQQRFSAKARTHLKCDFDACRPGNVSCSKAWLWTAYLLQGGRAPDGEPTMSMRCRLLPRAGRCLKPTEGERREPPPRVSAAASTDRSSNGPIHNNVRKRPNSWDGVIVGFMEVLWRAARFFHFPYFRGSEHIPLVIVRSSDRNVR